MSRNFLIFLLSLVESQPSLPTSSSCLTFNKDMDVFAIQLTCLESDEKRLDEDCLFLKVRYIPSMPRFIFNDAISWTRGWNKETYLLNTNTECV